MMSKSDSVLAGVPTDKVRLEHEHEPRRASSRGLIPKAKVKTIKMTFVIVFGRFISFTTFSTWLWRGEWAVTINHLKNIINCHIALARHLCTSVESLENKPVIVYTYDSILKNILSLEAVSSMAVSVFVVCWSPYFMFDLLQVYGYIPATQSNTALATFIQSLAPLNSAANPLIYCLFSTRICRTLR